MTEVIKSFKDLDIKLPELGLIGDKIKMERILGKSIIVHGYKTKDSIVESTKGKTCLCLQISIKDEKRVIFIIASLLLQAVEKMKASDFPFETTIIKREDGRFSFT